MGGSETQAAPTPIGFEARFEHARAARSRGDLGEAVAGFRLACDLQPDNLGARCELAYTLHFDGRSDEAEALCLDVLARAPGFAAALACLGNIHRKRGEVGAALSHFQRAATAAPDNVPILAEVAWCLTELGRADEAEAVFWDILALDRRARPALRGLALASRARGRHAEALSFFRLLADQDPADAAARADVGFALLDLGLPEQAEAAFRAALRVAPGDPETMMAHGFALRAMGEREEALERFRLAAAIDPVRALPEAAVELLALGRIQEGTDVLHRVVGIDPENFHACMQLAEILRAKGALEACLPLCRALVRAYPERIEPVAELCRALIAMGRSPEAMALAVGDGEKPSRQRLALRLEVAASCLDPAFAREALAASEVEARRDADLWLRSVETHLALSDAQGARARLDQPVEGRTPAQIARRRLAEGRLASLEWRIDDAIAEFDSVLAVQPQAPDAHLNLARLHLLRLDAEAAARHNGAYLRQSAAERTLRGQSLAPSQTQVGHLLNELRIDGDLFARLRAAAGDPDALCEAVRDNPDSTPAALTLLLALRQTGALDQPERSNAGAERPRLPRRILRFWPDPTPPDAVREGFRRCEAMHPDWSHTRLHTASALAYVAANFDAEVLEAFRSTRDPGQFAGLVRLAFLYREGGVYIDALARPVAPLDPLPGGAMLWVRQDDVAALADGFLGCAPGDAVVGLALDRSVEAINRGDNDIPWLATGPGLLSRAFVEVLAGQGGAWRSWLARRRVCDSTTLREVLIAI